MHSLTDTASPKVPDQAEVVGPPKIKIFNRLAMGQLVRNGKCKDQ